MLIDICFSLFLSFIRYFLIPFVAKSFRDVSLKGWEVYWPPWTDVPRWSLFLDTVKFYIDILYLFSECNFHLFLYWSSSDTLLSSDRVLGPALSNAACTYGTGYWAQPFPMQFEHMRSIGPYNSPSKSCFSASQEKRRILIFSSDLPYDLASLGQIVTIRVYLLVTHPWHFSAPGMPSFNFGNSFVSHVQRLDENPTAVKLSGNLSG